MKTRRNTYKKLIKKACTNTTNVVTKETNVNDDCICIRIAKGCITCPITHILMVKPVVASDGNTYEESVIVKGYFQG